MGSAYLAGRTVVLHDPPDADRRQQGLIVRQEPRAAALDAAEESHVQRRGRRGRGQGRAAGDYRVSARAAEVPEAGRTHSEGRAAGRASGNRQDAAGARDCGRSECSVLLDFRFGLRGNVRRRGREPRARSVRAGQEERSLHHLHRRNRRRGTPSRRRPRRRTRRARADFESVAGGDGRLRIERRRHSDGGDQPS